MAEATHTVESLRRELEERRAEVATLRESAEHLRAVLNSLEGTPVMLLDRDATVLSLFRGPHEEGYGLEEPDIVGSRLTDFTPGDVGVRVLEKIRRVFESGESLRFEQNVELPTGTFTHDIHYSPVRGENGEVRAVLSLSRDITDRVRAEEQGRRLASFDSLTGLPNRRLFREELARSLDLARRHGRCLGLLFVDLDRFKRVNDTLGHHAGDRLLAEVASRLMRCVRLSDAVGRAHAETAVSRLGGDEFTVLLTEISDPRDANRVAERILKAFATPIRVEAREVFATVSVGIAVYPHDGGDAESLLRHADAAMYQAKNLGQGKHRFLASDLNRAAARQLHLESRLRGALERGDLALHYQAVRSSRSGRVLGAEALMRWNDAELATVSPGEFVPVAEETGLISELGAWALQEACAEWARLRDAALRPVRLAVNVSSFQLRQVGLVEATEQTLRDWDMSPDQLDFEITESAIMQDDEVTRSSLHQLSELGIGLVLDDFGTGYSSLSYLRRFPFDGVKIDRSFVSGITDDPDSATLAAAIIAMAQRLQLRVIAEGVETLEQASLLRDQGCEELQGYLISKPLPAERFRRFLDAEKEASGSDSSSSARE